MTLYTQQAIEAAAEYNAENCTTINFAEFEDAPYAMACISLDEYREIKAELRRSVGNFTWGHLEAECLASLYQRLAVVELDATCGLIVES